ncbi:hypothetical protein B296_00031180 [Ensete ventricosum]|uniref:Plant heme peroxidase family profile domain-containing protein n=1 Tax=Ensete ventricosum TaxID=4639 RepID=A0A426ZSV5_ENSVE|nr:hypothetical protein B296_00031180 [Ensete ventricosum]
MRGRRQARLQSPGFPRPSSGLSAPYFHVRFQGPQSAGQWTALSASPSAIAPTSTPTSMLTWPPYASKAVRPSILICPSMASVSSGFLAATILSLLASATYAQLSPAFYDRTCPNLQTIVGSVMAQVVRQEPRMGASIVRLFFHDCFVNVRISLFLSFLSLYSSFFFFFLLVSPVKFAPAIRTAAPDSPLELMLRSSRNPIHRPKGGCRIDEVSNGGRVVGLSLSFTCLSH